MKSISSKIWQRPAQGGAGHAVRVSFSIKSHKNALMCDVHSEMEKDVRKGWEIVFIDGDFSQSDGR